jgi:hypothetical protein
MFKNPAGEENGNCEEPIRIKGKVFCNTKFNINQDLTTDTTTLIIKKNEFMYGEWYYLSFFDLRILIIPLVFSNLFYVICSKLPILTWHFYI